jgi:hypothetical protein
MQPSWTSKSVGPSQSSTWIFLLRWNLQVQLGSSVIVLLVFMSFVSLPVGCHAFVSSMLSMWWWVVDACTLFTTPITVSARTCQQWQVPLVDGRRATYELHGVAANGLTMCMLCCICMYGCLCKMWRNCGWRWDNKFAILNFISSFYFVLHVVFNLVTYPITWL